MSGNFVAPEMVPVSVFCTKHFYFIYFPHYRSAKSVEIRKSLLSQVRALRFHYPLVDLDPKSVCENQYLI